MKYKVSNFVPVALSALLCGHASSVEAATTYAAHVDRAHKTYVQHHHTLTLHEYFAAHPKVRAVTIGAGAGTALGAVTGMVTGRGILRGALIGAGTGAGVGLVRSSTTMRRHPVVKNVATGSLIGWGVGMAEELITARLCAPLPSAALPDLPLNCSFMESEFQYRTSKGHLGDETLSKYFFALLILLCPLFCTISGADAHPCHHWDGRYWNGHYACPPYYRNQPYPAYYGGGTIIDKLVGNGSGGYQGFGGCGGYRGVCNNVFPQNYFVPVNTYRYPVYPARVAAVPYYPGNSYWAHHHHHRH